MNNCGKDDMEICYYPAFIIVNSFQKNVSEEDASKFILSSLCVCDGHGNAFVTKFIVIRKLTPKNL